MADTYFAKDEVTKTLLEFFPRISDTFIKAVVEQIPPAADVRPVVRGKWKRVDYEPCGHDYICSECGCKSDGPWNFCPNCGADMREVQR